MDAVIITATTKKRDPVDQAIQLCHSKGKIVVVGVAVVVVSGVVVVGVAVGVGCMRRATPISAS